MPCAAGARGTVAAPAANLSIQVPAGTFNQPVVVAVVPIAAQGATPAQMGLDRQMLGNLNVPPPPAVNNVPA